MLFAVLSGFILALFAPWLHRLLPRNSGWLLALLPATLFAWFCSLVPGVNAGPLVVSYPWIPGLDIHLSFLVDGLSLLFALLISGIGFFIVAYAGRYLEGHRDLGRFYVLLLCFMASMLGLVLSDNLISLFVFWELTSITSYLLIGFNHEDEKARKAALQGLFVTVGGGLALMTGFIMLALAGGSYELSELLGQGEVLREHGWYLGLTALILLGCFTKSAQFPFHFWLPNAMAAPTPVSAYLHSATMVKAGVYLMARLNPALGETAFWQLTLAAVGGFTMLMGVFLAARSTGIKRVLAYSTVMALGTLTMLIGIGTGLALAAAMAFLLAHSLYKGALFMIAGILDHEAGCKDYLQTGGFARVLPVTTVCAVLAALALAGVLPTFGFVAKELVLEAVLEAPLLGQVLLVAMIAAAILGVVVAAIAGIRPWFGRRQEPERDIHEAPPALLAGPLVLSMLGLLLGFAGPLAGDWLLAAAASSVYGAPLVPDLALWHGINTPLLISMGSLLLGGFLYNRWADLRRATQFMDRIARFGPERAYECLMAWLVAFSEGQTRLLQNGYLRYYLMTTLLSMVALVGLVYGANLEFVSIRLDFDDIRLHEYAVAGVLLLSAMVAVTSGSRLGAVASLGGLGFTVALTYVLFSAPDLGITQVLVETLTVILLVLVLFRLPRFLRLSPTPVRLRDAAVALTVGGTMTLLILSAGASQYYPSIAGYFIAESQPSGYGRNIVNVILVDFRALDTLGEIFVLALAATGVFAMIKLREEDRGL